MATLGDGTLKLIQRRRENKCDLCGRVGPLIASSDNGSSEVCRSGCGHPIVAPYQSTAPSRICLFTGLRSNSNGRRQLPRGIRSALHFGIENIGKGLDPTPVFDLASAVKIFQESALSKHGYTADHECELCPHSEVSKSFIEDLRDYLRRFPFIID